MSAFVDVRAQRKSGVWEYFTYNRAEEKAKCSMCSSILKASGASTKGLSDHLKRKHNISVKSSVEKRPSDSCTSTGHSPKVTKIQNYFIKQRESLGEVVTKLVAVDGLSFNQIAGSVLLRKAFKADSYNLPRSRDYVKQVFMQHFDKVHAEIRRQIHEKKKIGNRFTISLDE